MDRKHIYLPPKDSDGPQWPPGDVRWDVSYLQAFQYIAHRNVLSPEASAVFCDFVYRYTALVEGRPS